MFGTSEHRVAVRSIAFELTYQDTGHRRTRTVTLYIPNIIGMIYGMSSVNIRIAVGNDEDSRLSFVDYRYV